MDNLQAHSLLAQRSGELKITVPRKIMEYLDLDEEFNTPENVAISHHGNQNTIEYSFDDFDSDPTYTNHILGHILDDQPTTHVQNVRINMDGLLKEISASTLLPPNVCDGTSTPMLPVSWEELQHVRPEFCQGKSKCSGIITSSKLKNYNSEKKKRKKKVSFSDVETVHDADSSDLSESLSDEVTLHAETDDYKVKMAGEMTARIKGRPHAEFNNLKQFIRKRKTSDSSKSSEESAPSSSNAIDAKSGESEVTSQKTTGLPHNVHKQTTEQVPRRRKVAPSTLQLAWLNNVGDNLSINTDKQLTDSSIDESSERSTESPSSTDYVDFPRERCNLSPALSSSSENTMGDYSLDVLERSSAGNHSKSEKDVTMPSPTQPIISSPEIGNMLDPKGNTMVHLAAATGNMDCLRLLSSKCGELLSQCNDLDQTPTEVAIVNGRAKCLNWLLCNTTACNELYPTEDHSRCLLHLACSVGHVNCLYTLLTLMQTEDMNMECVDDEGNTPAHIAAKNGHLSCLQTLVEFNMDVTMVNYAGQSPCQFADQNAHYNCVNYLIVVESCMQLSLEVSESANEVRTLREENASLKGYLEECLEINKILLDQQQYKETEKQACPQSVQSDVRNLLGDIVGQLQGLLIDHRNLLVKAEKGVNQSEQQNLKVKEVLDRAEMLTESLRTPRKDTDNQVPNKHVDEGLKRMKNIEQRYRQMSREPSPVTTEYSETKELMRKKLNEVSHRLMVFHTAIKERQENSMPLSVVTPPSSPHNTKFNSGIPSPSTPHNGLHSRSNSSSSQSTPSRGNDLRIRMVSITEESPNDEELRRRRLQQTQVTNKNIPNGVHNGVVEKVSGPPKQDTIPKDKATNAREFAVVLKNGRIDVRSNGLIQHGSNKPVDTRESRAGNAILTNEKCDSDTNSDSTRSLENELRRDREKEMTKSPNFNRIVAKFEKDNVLKSHPPLVMSHSAPSRPTEVHKQPPMPAKKPPPEYSPRKSTSDVKPLLPPKSSPKTSTSEYKGRTYVKQSPRQSSRSSSSESLNTLQPKALFQSSDETIIIQHDDDDMSAPVFPPSKPVSRTPSRTDSQKEYMSKIDNKNGMLAVPSGQSIVDYLNRVSPRAMVGTGPMIRTPPKKQILSPFQTGIPDQILLALNSNSMNPIRNGLPNGGNKRPPAGVTSHQLTNGSGPRNGQTQQNTKRIDAPKASSILLTATPLNNSLPLDMFSDNLSLGEDSVFEESTSNKSWYNCSSDEGY